MVLKMLETRPQYQRFNSIQESNENLKINSGNSIRNDENLQKVMVVLESLRLTQQYEEFRKPVRHSETEKKISKLNIQYIAQFSRISIAFENWAAQRRLVIQKLRSNLKRLEQLKSISCTGRFILSSADAIGTMGALILQNFENNWASSVLSTAGTLGMMSVACSVVEWVKTNDLKKEIITALQKDQELTQNIQYMFQSMDTFDKYVERLFPYGVDWNVLESMQKLGSTEDFVKRVLEKTHKTFDLPSHNLQVCLAILLSNIRKDPVLLEDENFLYTVKVFSKSPLAAKWWNRKRCPQLFPHSKNPKIFHELDSSFNYDGTSLHRFPLMTMQLLNLNSFPTAVSVLLNTVIALEALWELKEDSVFIKKETLTNLERVLAKEYDTVTEMYELVNPQYD